MAEGTPTLWWVGEGWEVMAPFKSEAQRAWMYANDPKMAKRWEKHTPKGKLPKKVGKKNAKRNKSRRSK
jgi:hypothetical protein